MLQNALDLSVSQEYLESDTQVLAEDTDITPQWAVSALTILNDNGIQLTSSDMLTRGQTAQVLYQANLLAVDAPGTAIFHAQK